MDMIMMGKPFQRDTFDKKAKPSNNPKESGYTLVDAKDTYMNENNQKQNNANVGNRPEWVGWSLE
jgi:hypothetical protein|tara:strand:+ start:105 stop:299 length:195 start_codon:yes stop_codon:yes gene_type:complete